MRRLSREETREALLQLGLDRPMARSFGLVDPSRGVRYDFHLHHSHQLLVPIGGGVTVETEHEILVGGPGQAIWIRAGQRHATAMKGPGASVFFHPRRFTTPRELLNGAGAVSVPRVLRAMAEYVGAQREAVSPAFFKALHELFVRAAKEPTAPSLPRPRSVWLARAVQTMCERLDEPDFDAMARVAGMSSRSFRRSLRAETGLSPRAYLHRARMLRARHLLEGRELSVLEVSLEVGFQSPSAFASAFRRFFGKRPSQAAPVTEGAAAAAGRIRPPQAGGPLDP